mmetsp:Transcript_85873/g.243568  ORF Transcript_85873/g.243568 Transcript_85873/m.243568 type:complete len:238 (-) Transcript_85873:269-982(-)
MAARATPPTGIPFTAFGYVRASLVTWACAASTWRWNSGRKSRKGMSARFRRASSSMTGCTRVPQCRSGKNFRRVSRTSLAAWVRAASAPAKGCLRSACSRYSSDVILWPDSSLRSRQKSRRSQKSAGFVTSWPCSWKCCARFETSDSVLKSPSLRTPLVFSRKTDESRKHRDISFASRVRSESVLPKPSQSQKSTGLSESWMSSAPHIQMPWVHARTVEPTQNFSAPGCRPRSRFKR